MPIFYIYYRNNFQMQGIKTPLAQVPCCRMVECLSSIYLFNITSTVLYMISVCKGRCMQCACNYDLAYLFSFNGNF